MRPPFSQTPIRPRVSTMPCRKTAAAAYLEMYKVVSEQHRLEQELERLEQRRDRILQQLDALAQQSQKLATAAQPIPSVATTAACTNPSANGLAADSYNLLYLEY